jgi:sRNA-binding protein
LHARFPNAFSFNSTALPKPTRKPLAIGIDKPLVEALPEIDPKRLRQALGFYVGSPPYLRGLSAVGAVRVDLAGIAVEPVSPTAAAHAVQRLANQRARHAARKAAKADDAIRKAKKAEEAAAIEAKKAEEAKEAVRPTAIAASIGSLREAASSPPRRRGGAPDESARAASGAGVTSMKTTAHSPQILRRHYWQSI